MGGSVGLASGCHAGGHEFDSGRTNPQGQERVLPVQLHRQMVTTFKSNNQSVIIVYNVRKEEGVELPVLWSGLILLIRVLGDR